MMDSREAFEAWAVSCGLETLRTDDIYHSLSTQIRWCVWQEATERCIAALEAYQVPVGNSAAGEIAAKMTMDALREIRDAIRG